MLDSLDLNSFNPEKEFKLDWVKDSFTSKEFVDYAEKFGMYLARLSRHKKTKLLEILSDKLIDGEKNKYDSQSLSTSQIRNFYSSLKTIELKDLKKGNYVKLYMLKPLLAYSYKRNTTKAFEVFNTIMSKTLDLIYEETDTKKKEKYFNNLCKIVEAFLAYHRAYGGK